MSSTSQTKPTRRLNRGVATAAERGGDEVSSLEAHLGYWLRYVSNHVSHAFKVKVEKHGVTVAEWVLMRELYDRDHMRPSTLSENVGLTRGAVSKLLDRLENKELIVRQADVDDGRAQVVALSRTGRRLVPKLAGLADDNDAQMFGHLDAKQQASLRFMLTEFVAFHGLKGAPID